MRHFSFRFKFILTMFLIVAAVSSVALYVTQRRVQVTYQHFLELQFHTQARFFSESREKRLDDIAKKCLTIAASPTVVEATESGNVDALYAYVTNNLRDEPKAPDPATGKRTGVVRRNSLNNNGSGSGNGNKPAPSVSFLRVVNAKGEFLEPRSPLALIQKNRNSAERRAAQVKLFVNTAQAAKLKEQEIAYGAPKQDSELSEFVITPILKPESGETIGSLVLGIAVQNFGEKAMYEFSEKTLLSGVWVGDKLYTSTVPENIRDAVAAQVSADIAHPEAANEPHDFIIDGVPHRLFHKLLNPDSNFPPAAQVCLYSRAEAIHAVHDLRQEVLGLGALAMLIGIILSLILSESFCKPIELLVKATRRIQEGDFSARVPARSQDEIGALARSFNEMADGLAQKERYRAVLSQVTDKEVAEQLLNGEIALGGELRHVTVLFCDIRGFTALTEGMPPNEIIAMLNEHMTMMNHIVHRHYGVVDKFVGDMIMAVFGAPKSFGNDALHAARCAMAMIQERRELNATSRYRIEVGIGVATGQAVAGCMGSLDRLNYTVLGERVNLASRLCSKARPGEILMDIQTVEQLPQSTGVTALAPVELKGFSDPQPVFHLTHLEPSAPESGQEPEEPRQTVQLVPTC